MQWFKRRLHKILRSNQSLKDVLTIHELAFILLIIITATSGVIGFNIWQALTQETQRINQLVSEVQQTRGDLYRQMKELFDAFFLDDHNARREYDQFTMSVENHFRTLHNLTVRPQEKVAINALHDKYKDFVTETSMLFDQQLNLSDSSNKQQIQQVLNRDLENGLFRRYELILSRTERLLFHQQSILDNQLKSIKKTSTIILTIPILLSIGLLFFSRVYLKRAIVKPINEVLAATSQISQGNLSVTATKEGVIELVAVSNSIKNMADELAVIQETLLQKEKEAAQGQLVPMLAHNIRNPLASIRATAQVIDDPELDQDTREALQGIISTVDRLERWTGALLAYLLPLKPQLQLVKIMQVINGACAPVLPKLHEKQMQLVLPEADTPDEIYTDVHLFEQVLYNFIANAVEASPAKTTIEVKISETQQQYLLQIIDNGPGIPFKPDANAKNSPSTKQYGTGLGIPFGFKVCQALEYPLNFSSRHPHGTCITITMPKPGFA